MQFDSFGDCKCKLTYVVLFFVLAFSIGCELLSGLSNNYITMSGRYGGFTTNFVCLTLDPLKVLRDRLR